jgi:hypothetical protein
MLIIKLSSMTGNICARFSVSLQSKLFWKFSYTFLM